MDLLLPDYNDPIISILLLIGIFFIIATLSYAYSIYKQDKKRAELVNFLNSFHSESRYDITQLQYNKTLKEPLALLAYAYLKSGEYNKSIELYLYLLKQSKDDALLLLLAKAYLKAGFLKRAEKIYLEILSKQPRTKEALYALELIYEKLQQFQEAKEIIEILNNLHEDVSWLELHLNIQELKNKVFDPEKKYALLEELLKKSSLKWPILRELFRINPKRAWSFYEEKYFPFLLDILQNLTPPSLEILKKSVNLQKLYTIKGQLLYNCTKESDNFSLELLYHAYMQGFKEGELEFVYICSHCKSRYPLEFGRCPNCHKAYKLQIEVEIAKKKKRDYTLF